MNISEDTIWSKKAREQLFSYMEENDHRSIKKINKLVAEIQRDPKNALLSSERLKGGLSGFYSKNINKKDKLVFWINEDYEIPILEILQCKGHYNDK